MKSLQSSFFQKRIFKNIFFSQSSKRFLQRPICAEEKKSQRPRPSGDLDPVAEVSVDLEVVKFSEAEGSSPGGEAVTALTAVVG